MTARKKDHERKRRRIEDLTAEDLKRLLSYDPETGLFIRLIGTSGNAAAGRRAGNINLLAGCVEISVGGRRYKAHRLAWLYMTGSFPSDVIDHIDGNPANNRWDNLRSVTQRENLMNRQIRSDNKSGVQGVIWAKREKKWRAEIKIKGKSKYLGLFSDIKEAAAARKKAEIELGFHPNHGRTKT